MNSDIYSLRAKRNNGQDFDFGSLRGKAILVVNTASKCGFTPQYAGLEALHKKYGEKGLAVIAFPCDQFGHQEPGSAEEISSFCSLNYGVTFPIMEKIEVNGKGTHPVFAYLKDAAPAALGKGIKWNFTKFLVSKDGQTIKRYPSATTPETLAGDIEKELLR